MNQPASNVTLKHPTGPWWTIYGTAGDIVQQIGQVFPHLTQNVGPTDFPAIVAQASAEWAQLVGATSQTPNQSNSNQGGNSGGWGNSGGNNNNNRAANQNQPGPGATPQCAHGDRKYVAPAGASWKAWMCPLPKDAVGKCDPEWIK